MSGDVSVPREAHVELFESPPAEPPENVTPRV